MDSGIPIVLRVNGEDRPLVVASTDTLLAVLRRDLELIGCREGCGVGMCGACTVLLDGRPVSGCLMLAAAAQGREILTVEGLESPDGELHPVQQAYVDHTAFQCSYCTPGFLLATKALLDENPDATEEEAREYLAGNLCRCGSYVKIIDAVMDARDRLRAV
jgi:carbon-monoxide dehydrogenase small subunit/isoquinoline 1-oxidoreductase alpha subunit/xanthine dehydrogenase YagT iron-sulfur-binding subunit